MESGTINLMENISHNYTIQHLYMYGICLSIHVHTT